MGLWARLTSTFGMLALTLGLMSTPAHAATCYGDYCSGQSPVTTGCSADGVALAHTYLYASSTRLDLMWSPTCKTQWARFNVSSVPSNVVIKVIQETGYEQSRIAGTNYTRQIYSPNLCVKAYYWWPSSGAGETWCV